MIVSTRDGGRELGVDNDDDVVASSSRMGMMAR